MNRERGSTWNKWDFHVHTPYSILNNHFGFNPDPSYKDDIEEFDIYVRKLFESALKADIVGIGITDYFSIDGYKRIREEYLNKPEKMIELFPNEEQRSKITELYIFPNIEFRISTFIGRRAKPVNFHILFSDSVPIQDIESAFLSQLRLNYNIDGYLPLQRSNIERIGKEYKKYNRATGSDYYVGLKHITVDENSIRELLNNELFRDKHMITIPIDEDLSNGVPWEGRDSISRKLLYQQSHCFMTSNPRTRRWALGGDNITAQIEEFGSIKPCIWGSDAHSYDRLFCPDQDRFCWIKAEPTFEGLQQILYEPEDRIIIQKDCPDEKDDHQIIDYIIFDDDKFQDKPIYLSEGLTTIIGGKSTGKSILLRHIAKSIDEKQVREKERKLPWKSLEVKAEVFWKDGVSGERKIIYIPQSWLNNVVDESGGDSQLNGLVREILLQQPIIHSANDLLNTTIATNIDITKRNINEYVLHINKARDCEKQLSEFGRSSVFESTIIKLEKQRENFSTEAGITDEILQNYSELEKSIAEKIELLEAIEKQKKSIKSIKKPKVYIPEITDIGVNETFLYNFNEVLIVKELFKDIIQQMNDSILTIWTPAIQAAMTMLLDKEQSITQKIEELNKQYEPLKQIVMKNDQLKKIDNQIKEEKLRWRKAITIEENKAEHISKAEMLKEQILESRRIIRTAYEDYSKKLFEINSPDTNLEFKAIIEDRKKELFDSINSLFDNRNLKSYRPEGYSFSDIDTFIVDDGLFETLWDAISKGILTFKGGNDLQSVLEKLFSDWLYIHYVVYSGDDTINCMSPGKKALVLLELIVNLEKSKCPILIDQPEDDLDNRSIYTELVKYLREKKRERQIIVVTHNANVVIGADAEEVIIANQEGKEAKNYSRRFEYRCGAIENVSQVKDDNGSVLAGILNQKGIQEQICDILEGGKDAFEKRWNKYFAR